MPSLFFFILLGVSCVCGRACVFWFQPQSKLTFNNLNRVKNITIAVVGEIQAGDHIFMFFHALTSYSPQSNSNVSSMCHCHLSLTKSQPNFWQQLPLKRNESRNYGILLEFRPEAQLFLKSPRLALFKDFLIMPDKTVKHHIAELSTSTIPHPTPSLTHPIVTPPDLEWKVRTSLHTHGLKKSIGLKEICEIGWTRIQFHALCHSWWHLHQGSISNLAIGFASSFLLCPLPIFINNMFIKVEVNFELVRVHPPILRG